MTQFCPVKLISWSQSHASNKIGRILQIFCLYENLKSQTYKKWSFASYCGVHFLLSNHWFWWQQRVTNHPWGLKSKFIEQFSPHFFVWTSGLFWVLTINRPFYVYNLRIVVMIMIVIILKFHFGANKLSKRSVCLLEKVN